jgi:protoporphyrinogen/coproporphyrinogen III oxidase
MSGRSADVPRVAVVGAGVSGLTVAYRLFHRDPPCDVVVLEADDVVGGKLRNVEVGGLSLPAGADSILARKPWAVELCRELGIGGELVEPRASGAYLWTERGLVAYPTGTAFGIPSDLGDVFRWPGVSRSGRRRALADLWKRKRRAGGDESLGSILRRRFGDEPTDRAIAPLLAGLYAGDVDGLSVQATFPELQAWEAAQGSLLRGAQAAARRTSKADAGPMFLKPRAGVQQLTDELARRLGDRVRTRTRVAAIQPRDGVWRMQTDTDSVDADVVVCTTNAPTLATILPSGPAVAELAEIRFVSTGAVLSVYGRGSASKLPAGSGFVVPRGAAPMTACTWLSSKWPDPAYGDRAVLRCFVGAAGDEDVLDAPDDDLIDACSRHLAALLPLPKKPEHAAVVRWPQAMPQYAVGHLDRVHRVRRSLPAGIFVVGQSLDGVGIADCVRAAGETAEAVATSLEKPEVRA